MVECPRRAGGSRTTWVTESLGAIEIGILGSRDLIKISLALLFSLPITTTLPSTKPPPLPYLSHTTSPNSAFLYPLCYVL